MLYRNSQIPLYPTTVPKTPLNMFNAVIGNVENPYRIRTRQRTTGQIQYTRDNTSIYTSRHSSFQCRAISAYNDLPKDLIGKYYDPRLVRDPDKAEQNDICKNAPDRKPVQLNQNEEWGIWVLARPHFKRLTRKNNEPKIL